MSSAIEQLLVDGVVNENAKGEMSASLWRIGDLRHKLHDGQMQLYEWWAEQGATLSVLHCARGYGKTWLLLCCAIEECLKTKNRRCVYAAPTREQAKQIVVPTAQLILDDAPDDVAPQWLTQEHAFVFKNGSRIIVDGADDERGNHLRGPFAHLVICDEAGFWRHCNYVVKAVLMPQVQRVKPKPGRMLIASTSPESVGHDFVGLVAEAKANGAYVRRTIYDNPRLTPEERKRHLKELGGETSTMARRELLCDFVTESERAVVPEFDAKRHVCDVADNDLPRFRDFYVAIDLGMTDFTHVLFGWYWWDQAQLVIVDELLKNYSPVSVLAPLIAKKEKELFGDFRPFKRVSDNHPMEIAEFANQHRLQPVSVPWPLTFEPADNREPEVLINRLRVMFSTQRMKIAPRCENLIHQLEVGVWNERRTDFERLPGIGHLDGVMALAYLAANVAYNRSPYPVGFGRTGETWVPPHVQEQERARNELWTSDVKKLRV